MAQDDFSRREWLALWSVGLAAVWADVVDAHEHAHQALRSASPTFAFFSPRDAADVDAICAQIIPTDETPGAREAGIIHFIDRALTTFEQARQDDYRRGLAEARSRAAEMFPGATGISELKADQQLALVKALDGSPFFELVRTHTMLGFLGSPDRGGNRDLVGWHLLGMDGRMSYRPPFGYYDAEASTAGDR